MAVKCHCSLDFTGVPKDPKSLQNKRSINIYQPPPAPTPTSPGHPKMICLFLLACHMLSSPWHVTPSSLHRANDRPLKAEKQRLGAGHGRAQHMKLAGTERSHKSDLAEKLGMLQGISYSWLPCRILWILWGRWMDR